MLKLGMLVEFGAIIMNEIEKPQLSLLQDMKQKGEIDMLN